MLAQNEIAIAVRDNTQTLKKFSDYLSRNHTKHDTLYYFIPFLTTIADYGKDIPEHDLSIIYIMSHYILLKVGFPKYKKALESLTPRHWLYCSPVIASSKTEIANAPLTAKLSYVALAQGLRCPIDEVIFMDVCNEIKANGIPRTWFKDTCTLVDLLMTISHSIYTLSVKATRGKSVPDCFNLSRAAIARGMMAPTLAARNEVEKLPFDSRRILCVMDKPFKSGSDFIAASGFLEALRDANYTLDVCYCIWNEEAKIEPVNIFDQAYPIRIRELTQPFKCRYKSVFFITHAFALEPYILSMKLADHTMGMLGHLCSSGFDLNHFFIPEWDEGSYSERNLVRLPGMACCLPNISLREVNKVSRTKTLIAVALTGEKLNKTVGPRLAAITKIAEGLNIEVDFCILLGSDADAAIRTTSLVNLHLLPYLDPSNFNIICNDKAGYFGTIEQCDFVICMQPYTPYISALDFVSACKPIVVLREPNRVGSQYAARILEVLGLDFCVAGNTDEEMQFITDLLNKKYCTQITNKIRESFNADLINEHNARVSTAFMDKLYDIGYTVE